MSSPVAFLLSFSFEFMFNLNFCLIFLSSARFRRGFDEVSARFQRGFSEPNFHKFKLNINSNENESKNASGGACARGAKRPRVGVLTRCVFVFVSVLIYV